MPTARDILERGCDLDGDVIFDHNGCNWVVICEIFPVEIRPAYTNNLDDYAEDLRRRGNINIDTDETYQQTQAQRHMGIRVKSIMA